MVDKIKYDADTDKIYLIIPSRYKVTSIIRFNFKNNYIRVACYTSSNF